jgi:acyl-coenzyme A synthetase/AMP-(fatty) acid ligase
VLDLREDDVVLPVPKLFFGYARDLTALYPFGVGGAGIVFGERSTPERLFELIASHRPTILVCVPTMMAAMVAHPTAAEQDLSCLRLCTSAGEALPAELHRKWDNAFGVPVVDGIGSSEAYHIYVSNRPGAAKPGTLGRTVPGYSARIVDDTGAELPDGEIGALAVTGPTVAFRYHGDPEKSAATFDGDTVLSSDLFVRDADGYLSYRGRADDLLKVGGIWVAPSEIEHCLIGHDDVVDCAVLGYTVDGLVRPRAYVVLRDDATTTPEDLQNYARSKLAGHKYPREVVLVAELPRTSNGKLDRRALRGLADA